MATQSKIFAPLVAIAGLIIAGYLLIAKIPTPTPSVGSVTQGSEQQATTTDTTFVSTFKVLNTGGGALGSVTVTAAGNNTLYVYDATTTNRNLRTNTATTTIALFPVEGTVGTYVFDAIYRYGLLIEITGTNVASSTISFR